MCVCVCVCVYNVQLPLYASVDPACNLTPHGTSNIQEHIDAPGSPIVAHIAFLLSSEIVAAA